MSFGRTMLRTLRASLLVLVVSTSGCMRSPESKSARHMEAGNISLQKNDAARAILAFRNAVAVMPKNSEAHYRLGLAYLAARDPARAVASFRRTLELNPKHAGAQLG